MKKHILFFLFLFRVLCAGTIWNTPISISTGGSNASEPHLGMDKNGNVVAIWIENGNVISNSLPFGGSWGSNITLSSSGLASSPRIVVDQNGNATAVWLDSSVVTWNALPFGGSWGTNASLSASGATTPQIAVDASGNVVVVWAISSTIQTNTRLFGGSFAGSPTTISSSPADSPQVAIGNNGTVVAVWHQVVSSVDCIFAATTLITGSWNAAQQISTVGVSSQNAQIAVDINGNALAMWFRFTLTSGVFSNTIVQAAYLPVSGSWGTPVDVSTPGIYDPTLLFLKVLFNPLGNGIGIWTNTDNGSSFTAQGSILPKNGSWLTPTSGSVSNLYLYSGDCVLGQLGTLLIVYMSFEPQTNIISINSVELANVVGTVFNGNEQAISQGSVNAFPKVAGFLISGQLQVAAIWEAASGSTGVIEAATGTTTFVQNPTNLTGSQSTTNFTVFTENFNSISWLASPSSNTVGYKITRNGKLIAILDASTFQYIDHNQEASATATYTVFAIDNFGFASTGVSITL